MGLFDGLVKAAAKEVEKQISQAASAPKTTSVHSGPSYGNGTQTVNPSQAGTPQVGNGKNHDERFVFSQAPRTVEELRSIPEIAMDSPFKTAALAVLVLCNYEIDAETTYAMMDILRGPDPLSPMAKQFIRERLDGKGYKPYSFFEGATPENGYVPTKPMTITVSENPYSFDTENWATLFVHSSGADSPRQIQLRKKPSTGQWFVTELQCLSDIRVPVQEDPWA